MDALYGRSPGYWAVTLFDRGKVIRTKWYDTDANTLDQVAPQLVKAGDRFDVYASVATHREPQGKGRGTRASVLSIPGFWADLDIGTDGHKPAASGLPNPPDVDTALSVVEGLPEPSAVIHSGGGLQAWWLFDHPWVFEDAAEAAGASEAWQRRLVAEGERLGFHVDPLPDLPRILRVPGTQNRKLDTPRPVVMRTRTDARYPSAELTSFGKPRESAGSGTTEIPEHEQNDCPLSWAEILEPHGWTHAGTQADGTGLWCRPGKSPSEGHSATTDHNGVPVMVNFSASSGLPTGEGQKLTKLRVYALLNHGGDFKAALAELEKLKEQDDDELAKIAEQFAEQRVKWSEFWGRKPKPPEWFCEPLIERGRHVAFYSDAKAGKSLLWQEICQQLVQGRPTLGRAEGTQHDPIRILYLDQENTLDDLHERYTSKMGGTADTWNLDGLFYYSFPSLAFMDTAKGGLEVFALAKYHDVDLVVIDTLSRVVEGSELDNDTYNEFYKHTGVRLKRAGIAMVRLDHSGKDVARGMRGASSKTTDVDEVWQLAADDDALTLKRTHTRSNHGASEVEIQRKDGPLRHELVAAPDLDEPPDPTDAAPTVATVIAECKRLGIDMVSGPAVKAALRDANPLHGYSHRLIEAAVRQAKGE